MLEDWKTSSLGDCCTFISGGTPSKENKQYWGGGFPWVSARDLKHLIIRDTELKLTEKGMNAGVRIAPQGSVLVLVRGMTLLKDLPVCYVDRNVAFNQDIKVLIPEPNLSGLFLTHALIAWKKQILELVDKAGHGTGRLDTERLKEFTIDYPTNSDEQMRILNILSTWDRAIDLTAQLMLAKRQYKQGLMQQLLKGRRRFQDFRSIPWQSLNAGDIFQPYSARNNGTEELLSVTQDRGVLPRSMLDTRVVMPSGELTSYKLIEPGNFIISLRSFQGGIEYSEYRGLVSPAYTILKSKLPIIDSFYKHLFKSQNFISHLGVAIIGIRDGKQINFDDFASIRLAYPIPDEQQRIAEVLDTCDNELKLLNHKLALLKKQKQGLMQQLLTGKVRVKT